MVSWDLFVVSLEILEGSAGYVPWKTIQSMPLQNVVYSRAGNLNPMVSHEIPCNTLLAYVVGFPEIENLIDDLLGLPEGLVLRARLAVYQSIFATFSEITFPPVEVVPRNPKITACLGYIPGANSML